GRKGTGLEVPDRPGDEDLQRPGQPAAARSIAPSEDRIVELTVGELAHGGAAVARVDGRVVFVEGAIPGETVEAEVTHRRKDFWRAEAIERALPAFARAAEDPAAAHITALQFTWAPGTSDLLWAPYPPGSADPGFGGRAAGWIPELNLNDDSIGIDDAGRHFRVRPEAFVQVNARQRDVLYQRAVAFARISGGDRV